MQQQVKIVSLMDLRANIGSLISEVMYGDQKIVIERYGSPVCEIVKHEESINKKDQEARNAKIDRLFGAIKMTDEEMKEWLNVGQRGEKEYRQRINKAWEEKS